jgi:hypothetical protein
LIRLVFLQLLFIRLVFLLSPSLFLWSNSLNKGILSWRRYKKNTG